MILSSPPEISSWTLFAGSGRSRSWSTYERHDRLADRELAGVRLLLADDHLEERRLARAVGADHADDAAARQVEGEVLHEETVAVGLLHALRLDDDVAEARAGRDEDLLRLAARLGAAVGEQRLVALDARLALRVPRARRHLDPLELALQRAALRALGLLLELEPALLLLEPARVVALPRDARAAVELEDPAGDVVEEVAVVSDGDDGAGILGEVPLEPGDRLGVEVVRRLVEEQEVRLLEEDLAERDAPLLAARDLRDVRVRRREAERVHRDLELTVELPRVGRLDRVLHALVLRHDLLALRLGELLGELLVELLEALEQAARLRDGLLDVAEDVLRRVEPGVLREEADARAVGREGVAGEVLLDSRHDAEQGRLPGSVQAEDADLRAGQEREVDALQDLALRRDDLPQIDHRVDVLVRHKGRECIAGRESGRQQAASSSRPSDSLLIDPQPRRR